MRWRRYVTVCSLCLLFLLTFRCAFIGFVIIGFCVLFVECSVFISACNTQRVKVLILLLICLVQGYLSTHMHVVAIRYLNSRHMAPLALYAYSTFYPDTGQAIRVLAVTSSPTGFFMVGWLVTQMNCSQATGLIEMPLGMVLCWGKVTLC